jgi:rhodanese-related sulfurtransferase
MALLSRRRFATLALAFIAPGAAARAADMSYKQITAEELAAMMAHKDFALINVHIPYEGEIERTDAEIPFDKIGEHLSALPQDKAAKIVLYCRSGHMSAIAAKELAARGYTDVSDLLGGMNSWKASGHPIIEKPQ